MTAALNRSSWMEHRKLARNVFSQGTCHHKKALNQNHGESFKQVEMVPFEMGHLLNQQTNETKRTK